MSAKREEGTGVRVSEAQGARQKRELKRGGRGAWQGGRLWKERCHSGKACTARGKGGKKKRVCEKLTGKGGAVDGPAGGAVAFYDVTSLDHELLEDRLLELRWITRGCRGEREREKRDEKTHIGNDSVDGRVSVSVAVHTRRELTEVAGGEGTDGIVEAEDDAPGRRAVDIDVKLRKGY